VGFDTDMVVAGRGCFKKYLLRTQAVPAVQILSGRTKRLLLVRYIRLPLTASMLSLAPLPVLLKERDARNRFFKPVDLGNSNEQQKRKNTFFAVTLLTSMPKTLH